MAARYGIVTAAENWVTVVASSGSSDRLGHEHAQREIRTLCMERLSGRNFGIVGCARRRTLPEIERPQHHPPGWGRLFDTWDEIRALTELGQREPGYWPVSTSSLVVGADRRYAAVLAICAIDHDATLGSRPSGEIIPCLVRSPVQPASAIASTTIPRTRMC